MYLLRRSATAAASGVAGAGGSTAYRSSASRHCGRRRKSSSRALGALTSCGAMQRRLGDIIIITKKIHFFMLRRRTSSSRTLGAPHLLRRRRGGAWAGLRRRPRPGRLLTSAAPFRTGATCYRLEAGSAYRLRAWQHYRRCGGCGDVTQHALTAPRIPAEHTHAGTCPKLAQPALCQPAGATATLGRNKRARETGEGGRAPPQPQGQGELRCDSTPAGG